MIIARTRHDLEAVRMSLSDAGRSGVGPDRDMRASVALVPTMGALHDGHLSLIAHGKRTCSFVMASIFVNPTQFGPNEDLARYPRDEASDLAHLQRAGCDAVWLPGVEEMYPAGDATFIDVAGATDVAGPARGWEGDLRPGHFRGVATVVAKLFGQTRPDIACFGEKDWQQLQVIRRMTQDLCLGVRIDAVPTLREADGLALSSRNRFLSPAERQAAPSLYAGLCDAAREMRAGAQAGDACASAGQSIQARGLQIEYLALVDAGLLRIETLQPGARLIAAARLGSVRLLDNIDPTLGVMVAAAT